MNPPFCNFVQHDLKLFSSTGTISMPTFPNYRLDSGPVCDPTITTSSKDIADVPILNVMVYPNPTSAAFLWNLLINTETQKYESLDMQGATDGRDSMNESSLSTLICWKMAFI